jgi:hypothetical protein
MNELLVGLAMRVAQNPRGTIVSMGRLAGLGEPEQQALVQGQIPWWSIAAVSLVGGVALGVWLQRRWPQHVGQVW